MLELSYWFLKIISFVAGEYCREKRNVDLFYCHYPPPPPSKTGCKLKHLKVTWVNNYISLNNKLLSSNIECSALVILYL